MPMNEVNEAGRHARFERWEKFGLERVKVELANGGYDFVGGPPHFETSRGNGFE
jgi:hypothetical protein